jgi:hypothetical protein
MDDPAQQFPGTACAAFCFALQSPAPKVRSYFALPLIDPDSSDALSLFERGSDLARFPVFYPAQPHYGSSRQIHSPGTQVPFT